jgi:hypothetical protein
MNLRSVFIFSGALLFLSAPAWGDSLKHKSEGPSASVIHFNQGSNHSHSNIKFLGGFKSDDSKKHNGFFNIKNGHFVLHVPSGHDEESSGSNDVQSSDPVSTPEPAALSLLLVGFVGLAALAYRRVPSPVVAQ